MGFNVTQLVNDVLKVEIVGARKDDIVEYGVRWVVGQAASAGERVKRVNGELFIGAATNLVANVGVDDGIVENSFDNVDIFNTDTVAIDGNIFIKRRLYYHKLEFVKEGGTEYQYSWMCEHKLAGYIRPRIFIDDNGENVDFAYLGKYEASEDETGKARSVQNAFPRVSINRENSRKAARKNDGNGDNTDSRYGIMDLAEYHYHIVVPFEIEFATRHSQSIMQGAVSLLYGSSHLALTTEENDNIIVLTNSQAEGYVLGQVIGIGTSQGSGSVAVNRIVTDIQLNSPAAEQATITFDGDPVTVTEGNFITAGAWHTGATNGVKASSGIFKANNGKYPIVFRGYENPYGNIFKFVDGGKVVDHQLWVTDERSSYNDSSSSEGKYAAPFVPVSYVNAKSSDYVKKLGYDKMFPYARLPIEVGANNATYYADYYYENDGDRTLLVGGFWGNGSYAGLFYWVANFSLSASNIYIGFRLSYRPLKGVN